MVKGLFKRNEHLDFQKLNYAYKKEKFIDGSLYLDHERSDYSNELIFINDKLVNDDNLHEIRYDQCHRDKTLSVAYNTSIKEVNLKSDRFCTHPLFFHVDDDWLIFSTSLQFILSLLPKKKLNKLAAKELLDFGYILYGKTLIEGVNILEYATELIIDKHTTSSNKYWDFNINENVQKRENQKELREKLSEQLSVAVEESLDGEKDIIIPLSGGLDSRLILSVASKIVDKSQITTFTFGKKGTQNLEIAKEICKKKNIRQILRYIPSETSDKYKNTDWELYFDKSITINYGTKEVFPGYLTQDAYSELKQYGDVIFSGYMGDPLFGSHLRKNMFRSQSDFKNDYKEIIDSHRSSFHIPTFGLTPQHAYPEPSETFKKSLLKYNLIAGMSMHWDFAVKQQNSIKNGQINRYRNMFDVRLPFLSPKLFSFVSSQTSLNNKLDQQLYVKTLLNYFPEFFKKFPTTHSGGVKLNSGKIRKKLYKRGNQYNEILDRKFGFRLFPTFPNRNIVEFTKIIRCQKSLNKFILDQFDFLVELNVISQVFKNDISEQMVKDKKKARLAIRLSTLAKSVKKYNIEL